MTLMLMVVIPNLLTAWNLGPINTDCMYVDAVIKSFPTHVSLMKYAIDTRDK